MTGLDLPCLTLHQPWASALFLEVDGAPLKRFETRSWPALRRGRFAIHAGKSQVGREFFDRDEVCELFARAGVHSWDDLPFGEVLGTAWLDAYYRTDDLCSGHPGFVRPAQWITPREQIFGNFSTGRWAWLFNAPLQFDEPIPARGYRRIWRWRAPEALPQEYLASPEPRP